MQFGPIIEGTPTRRRRFRRVGDGGRPLPLLADGRAPATVIYRDRVFRWTVATADVLASLIVVGLLLLWLPARDLSWTALIVPVLVPIVHAASGLYVRDGRVMNKSTLDEAPLIFGAATLTTVISYLLQSGILAAPIGAKVVASVWLGLTVCILACRVLGRAAGRAFLPPERCLVLGDDELAERIGARLENAVGVNEQIVGVMPWNASQAGPGAALAEAVDRLQVHRVVITGDADSAQIELEAIHAAKALGVKVSVLPRVLEVLGSSATYDFVDGLTVLGVPRFGLSPSAELAKRTFDIAGSVVALVLLAPVILAIAVAVRFTSSGPVFFRQTRIGRGGKPFSMLKFRSMYDGADHHKDALRSSNEQQGLFKIADDPRTTPLGRWLRRSSLDELPQLFNVLRGEMGLVGPRPLVPEEDVQIRGWHRRRLHLTPGMTGPWQVLGTARIPLTEMVTIDYLYVANWSLWNDVKIMVRTIGTVVARRGR